MIFCDLIDDYSRYYSNYLRTRDEVLNMFKMCKATAETKLPGGGVKILVFDREKILQKR